MSKGYAKKEKAMNRTITVNTSNCLTRIIVRQFQFIVSSVAVVMLLLVVASDTAVSAESSNTINAMISSSGTTERSKGLNLLSRQTRKQRIASVHSLHNELVKVAESDTDATNRRQAIQLMGEATDPLAAPVVSRIAKSDASFEVRAAALKTIRSIQGPESLPLLTESMVNDPHPYVRLQAAEELGSLGQTRVANEAAWKEAARENPTFRRARAIEVVGNIGDRQRVADLQKISDDVKEPDVVRNSAWRALNQIEYQSNNNDAARVALLRGKLHEIKSIRWAIARLVDIRTKESAQILIDAARSNAAYGTPEYIAKPFAKSALLSLYDDASTGAPQRVDRMLSAGIAEPLPAE